MEEPLRLPLPSARWRTLLDERVRRASMVADGAGAVVVVVPVFRAGGDDGLVWIRLLRSILLGKYGSIALFVLCLFWVET